MVCDENFVCNPYKLSELTNIMLSLLCLLLIACSACCLRLRSLSSQQSKFYRSSLLKLASSSSDSDRAGFRWSTPTLINDKNLHIKCSAVTLGVVAMFSTVMPTIVFAGDDEKAAKAFELCVSKCVFAETKPPPVGADASRLEPKKTRTEIIRDCRKKCAKTSDQLLLGKPKAKGTSLPASTDPAE